MAKISAVVITRNEAQYIEKCILALQQVAEEVIVVDSGSEDETVAIAKRLGAKVIIMDWEGYSKNKNTGNAAAANDWILSIDADEMLSEELIASIQNCPLEENTVYLLDRINNYCGQWIKHSGWYPDWKVRLFNRQHVQWKGDFVHETLVIPSTFRQQKLVGKLHHYSYETSEDHLQRIHRYATLAAQEMQVKGKQTNWIKMWLSPLARFLKTLIVQRAFLDGKNGWIISKRNALLVYLKYQKLQTLNRTKRGERL